MEIVAVVLCSLASAVSGAVTALFLLNYLESRRAVKALDEKIMRNWEGGDKDLNFSTGDNEILRISIDDKQYYSGECPKTRLYIKGKEDEE